MVENICNLLDLDLKAGLGRRLAEVEIKQDPQNPNLFYILSKNVVEAFTLAYALSVQAKEILHLENVCFRAERISPVCQ